MKKLILFLALAISLSSCLTVGMIKRNCDTIANICSTTETIYRDTTIYVKDTVRIQLPADTVTIEKILTVNNGLVSLTPVSVSKGLISAKAWVLNNRLNVDAWLNKPYVETVRADTITITKYIEKQATQTTIKEKYIPTIYKYALGICITIIVGIGLFLLLKFKVIAI